MHPISFINPVSFYDFTRAKRVGIMGLLCVLFMSSGALFIGGCFASSEDSLKCDIGELRYSGRPPRRLFGYENECRDDCFSALKSKGATNIKCKADCNMVSLASPVGQLFSDNVIRPGQEAKVLVSDRRFAILDDQTIDPEHRGLLFQFSYSNGAPEPWTFLSGGAASYFWNQTLGQGEFEITTSVVEIGAACTDHNACTGGQMCASFTNGNTYCADSCDDTSLCPTGRICASAGNTSACAIAAETMRMGPYYIGIDATEESETIFATPGRLVIDQIDASHMSGQFFTAFQTDTLQPQGQMQGCINVNLSAPVTDPNGMVRRPFAN